MTRALLLILLLSTSAWASGEPLCQGRATPAVCADRLDTAFARAFEDEDLYVPLACHNNVRALARRLSRQGFRLSQFRVLFIGASMPLEGTWLASGKQFKGLQARGGEANWIFHVVLEAQGQILDLDYTNSPRLIPAPDYFRAQFGEEQLPTLGYRAIPAPEYVRDYSDVWNARTQSLRNWAFYLHDVEHRHPMAPLADFKPLN